MNTQCQFLIALVATVLLGCRASRSTSGSSKNSLVIDGSSTVYPIVSAMADDFSKGSSPITIVVNKSGTGSGLQRFARREIDIAAASRPIDKQEKERLKASNLTFLEIPFAADGVCIIVNKMNSWARSMTFSQLQTSWQPHSPVKFWADLDKRWPKSKIAFYGPTDNHGTYDYFLEAMSPKSSTLREDVQSNQEYNAIVQAVADDKNGIGYVGLAYFVENRDKVECVKIDFGKGPVAPSQTSVSDGSYGILSRPLLLYVDSNAYRLAGPVRAFVEYGLSAKGRQNISEAHYVNLSPAVISAVSERLKRHVIGSAFTTPNSFLLHNLASAEVGDFK